MRRANVEEPIMKNDSIAVELRRKGSRIWVVSHLQPNALESVENSKMTPCPTSTGRPIVVLPKLRWATQYRNCVFPAPNVPQIANGIARSSFAILSGCSFQDIFVVCPAIPDRSFTEAVLELDIL